MCLQSSPSIRKSSYLSLYEHSPNDIVMVCALERDAQRLPTGLPQRWGKYGLPLHPTKTQVTRFTPPSYLAPRRRGTEPTPSGAFDLLGFTHDWGRSRQGNWVVKRQTATTRLARALTRIRTWCRDYRHAPVPWQPQQLVRKLRGHLDHYVYYAPVCTLSTHNDQGLLHRLTTRSTRRRDGWSAPTWDADRRCRSRGA